MTTKRLEGIIAGITYKPGCWVDLTDTNRLGIHITVWDSERPGQTRVVDTYHHWMDDKAIAALTDREVVVLIMGHFADLELHEVYEWFKMDGQFVMHPHPIEPLFGEYDRKASATFKHSLSYGEIETTLVTGSRPNGGMDGDN